MAEHPVWLWPEGKEDPMLAGTIRTDGRGTEFKYDGDYLHLPDARPLDKEELRYLGRRVFRIPIANREGLPGILADAGPDSWGRMMLAQTLKYQPSALDALIHSANDGVGNLAVGDLSQKPVAIARSLSDLDAAILRRQAGIPPPPGDQDIDQALSPDTALGGAKPKASIMEDGMLHVAKFPERGDPPEMPFLEAAAMALANRLQIRTAEATPKMLESGRSVLLVKRFDRKQQGQSLFRLGFASALTVMGPRASEFGRPERSYLHLARNMKRWCAPEDYAVELRELWRRIAFNGVVGNNDDHPRNHGFICEQGKWRLSPAFDIVPTYLPKSQLSLSLPFIEVGGQRSSAVTAQRLVMAAPVFGLSIEEAREDLLHMLTTVYRDWRDMPAEMQMPGTDDIFRHTHEWVEHIYRELLSCKPDDLAPPAGSRKRWRSSLG